MNTVQRVLLRGVLVALVAIVCGPVGVAMAEPPTLTLESPTNGSVSNNRTPSFSGASNDTLDDVTLNIYAGTSVEPGALVQTLTTLLPPLVSVWSAGPAEPLADGAYTVQATQTNLLGETGSSEPPVTFTVDTAAPTVSLNQPASPSNDTTPSFTGSASDGTPVTVQIYAGGTAAGPVLSTATAAGTGGGWVSGGASPALSSGKHTYTAIAIQESSLGNPAGESLPVTFTVDTAAPTVSLNQPASPSRDTTPSFTGSASDSTSVTVHIHEGGTTAGPVVSTATAAGTGGSWASGNASPTLSDGKYTAIATQESSLGNPEGASNAVTFTVDTAPPTVLLNQPVSPSNDTTPSFTGSASDSTSVTIEIYAGGTTAGPVVSTATAAGTGGGWRSGNSSPALSSGKHTYTAIAVQESSLGNPAGESLSVTFTVDTTSPTVSLNQPASPSNNTTPSFAGSASDTTQVTVKVYEGVTATGSPVSSATATGTGGSWTSGKANRSLSDGRYTAIATQKSSLGNPEGMSNSVTFTVDTAAPTVSLDPPKSPSNDTTPSFTGSASDSTPITVKIYAGATTTGSVVPTATATATGTGGDWTSSNASPALADGQYTAVATQASPLGNHPGQTTPVTFTVDTVPPQVTLSYPAEESSTSSESQLVKGSASTGTGDLSGVTVQLFSGSSIVNGQVPLQSIVVNAKGGAWSATFGGLNAGTYTVRAEQSDEAGNTGRSEPVTFSVEAAAPLNPPLTPAPPASPTPSPAPTSPVAAFTWLPAKPTTGLSVVLVSSSTDVDSPITAYAWDVTGSGTFATGGPAITTSFATPGNHVVRLKVTDGDGLTSVATETIAVSAAPLVLMQPFPVVRIVGSESSSGAKISLLTVQAPVGTRVSVTCGGSHCPSRSENRVVVSSRKNSRAGGVLLSFGKFERSLQAGVVLEIRVSKPGEIGKYTSFRIRPNKAPARIDACVGPTNPKPIPCPTS
jgi:hypothetical protein